MPTGCQLLDATLREHISQRIAKGRLPVIFPDYIEARVHRSGSRCHACDQPITSRQIACDVEDRRHGRHLTLHLGVSCAVANRVHQARAVGTLRAGQRRSCNFGSLPLAVKSRAATAPKMKPPTCAA